MNHTSTNSSPLNDSPVATTSHDGGCKHHTRKGRCRMPVADPLAALCAEHARRKQKRDEVSSLSAELIAGLTEFKSAVPINDFLSRLLRLQAQDRIARAAPPSWPTPVTCSFAPSPLAHRNSTLKTASLGESSLICHAPTVIDRRPS